jgi:4-hydroxy-2-oxoheptanedioate aldolase
VTAGAHDIKARLKAGEQLVGAILRMPGEDTVAMLGQAGLDFVVIDCEHGPAEVGALRHHLALAQLHGMAVLVRIGADGHALTLRVLDQGVEGIVAAHIDTVAQAEALVRAAHYPPVGNRGFAVYTPAGAFGAVSAELHRARALDRTLVVAMLEAPTATRNAAAILSTPGIDGYLIGMADLRVSSGPQDLPIAEAAAAVHRAAARVGALRAELVNDVESARRALAEGVPLVVYNLTHMLMALFREMRVDVAQAASNQRDVRSEITPTST